MDKVTRTDQLGRLIELAGNAIALTRDGHRDPTKLLDVLQAFKENRHFCACGHTCDYQHHDKPDRPDFGPTQIRYLCELKPGMRIKDHNADYYPDGHRMIVKSLPYPRRNGWWIQLVSMEKQTIDYSLQDHNITPYNNGSWNSSNWLGYDQPAPRCSYRHCCHHRSY